MRLQNESIIALSQLLPRPHRGQQAAVARSPSERPRGELRTPRPDLELSDPTKRYCVNRTRDRSLNP
jgi:hypothetical protein